MPVFGNCNKKNNMKQLKKLFHPVVYIFFFWLLFSAPFFFEKNIPFSSTYQITFFPPWSAYPHNGVPVKNAAMPDVISQITPWKHLVISLWKLRQIPLWNMNSFAGTPLLANYQSAVLSPFNILFFILPFVTAWGLLVLLQPLLAGLFTYLFARSVKISKVGSLISSLSFMFSGFIVVWMGYGTLGYALLFLPLGMYAIEKFFEVSQTRYLLLLAFVLPLSFFSGHFQISLYVLLALALYVLYKIVVGKSLKKGLAVYLYMIFGMLLCLPQLLPSLEFYTQSLRSGIYQRSEVIPWGYLSTLLAPDFFGNPTTRNDWFGHYAEWNGFIGTVVLLLSFYGIRAWKKSIVLFLAVGGLLALLLALPTPLGDLIVTLHIPVLATSAASRIISLYCFFFALLGGFGWDQLVISVKEKDWKGLGIWIAGGGVLFAVLWVVVLGKLFMPLDKILIAKQNLLLPTGLFILAVFGTVVAFFLPKKITIIFLSILFVGIISLDMYRFVTKWQPFDPRAYMFEKTPVGEEFTQISGYGRAIGNYGAEVSNYYQLPSLEGYDALYPRRYGEFVSYVNTGILGESSRSVVSVSRNGKYTPEVLNLLNVAYVIHKKSDDNMPWTIPYWTYPAGQFSQVFEDNSYRILQNTKAYPHAYLAGSYKVETKNKAELDTLFGKNFDRRQSLVLEQKPNMVIQNDPKAIANIVSYKADKITITTQSKTNMLLFLSDTYYPGWKAYIDGKEAPILRADYAFRAVAVPKGNHTVMFVYKPLSFALGLIGAISGIFCLAVVSLFMRKKTIL